VARKARTVDRKSLEAQLERLTRRFTQRIAIVLAPTATFPPDVNTNAQVMPGFSTSTRAARATARVVTENRWRWGIAGTREATGRRDVRDAGIRPRLGITLKGGRVVIQGFGNVAASARLLDTEPAPRSSR